MALKKSSARQSPLEAIIDINFADPTAYGTSENAFSLPQNAIVLGGDLTVVTAWNSATSAALSLGDVNSATRYLSAVDLKTAARTALTVTGYKHTIAEFLKALLVQAGTGATAGDARLRISYIVQGRSLSNQG